MSNNIRNMNLPLCKSCIHFSPEVLNGSFTSHFTKCNKFGNKDLVSGQINHEFATSCRNDETLCGIKANYFKEDPNIKIKIARYNFLNYLPKKIIIVSVIVVLFKFNS